jgi:hypothetical protein
VDLQAAEECADVVDEGGRLFEGEEVAAAIPPPPPEP